jgi:carboxylesterase
MASVDAGPFELGPVGTTGPAVVCLHGLTGTPYEVRPLAEELARRGFACTGPLLPGHGESPEALAQTKGERWLDAALLAHDRLARTHARVYALGLSMGGVLALAIGARRRPAGVAVLAAPFDLGRMVRFGVPLARRLVRMLPKRPAIADPEARARHPGYDRMPLAAVAELMELSRSVESELAAVTAPLLLLYGRKDPTVAPANAGLVLAGVRSTDRALHILERSQHVLPVDRDRAEVAERVASFFQRLERER